MKNLSEIGLPLSSVHALINLFQTYPEIKQVILYGSRAKGTHRTGSDIDLCLVAPSLTSQQQANIETQIDDLLLPWKVDLCLAHQIDNPALRLHIKRVGIPFKLKHIEKK